MEMNKMKSSTEIKETQIENSRSESKKSKETSKKTMLEKELERRKESEKAMLETLAEQTKQLEQTKISLEESKIEIASLKETLDRSSDGLKDSLAHFREAAKISSLKASNLSDELSLVKNELKSTIEAESTSKKAMDDLALALKEVKEKLMATEARLEATKLDLIEQKGKFGAAEANLETLSRESRKEAELLKNTAERLRFEAEESLSAWNGKEAVFVNCIKRGEEEKNSLLEENDRLIQALVTAENLSKKSKEENHKLRDILKQAINEANIAREAAGIAGAENLQLKDNLSDKEQTLEIRERENEDLRKDRAAAYERIEELKRLLDEANSENGSKKWGDLERKTLVLRSQDLMEKDQEKRPIDDQDLKEKDEEKKLTHQDLMPKNETQKKKNKKEQENDKKEKGQETQKKKNKNEQENDKKEQEKKPSHQNSMESNHEPQKKENKKEQENGKKEQENAKKEQEKGKKVKEKDKKVGKTCSFSLKELKLPIKHRDTEEETKLGSNHQTETEESTDESPGSDSDLFRGSIFDVTEMPNAVTAHHRKKSSCMFLEYEALNSEDLENLEAHHIINEGESDKNSRKKKAFIRRFGDLLVRRKSFHKKELSGEQHHQEKQPETQSPQQQDVD